jgi:Spy/CpxP family protein refolding chaperone
MKLTGTILALVAAGTLAGGAWAQQGPRMGPGPAMGPGAMGSPGAGPGPRSGYGPGYGQGYGPGYGMGPGPGMMGGYGPGSYGMGPGMTGGYGCGMAPGMMSGYGLDGGMGPGMMDGLAMGPLNMLDLDAAQRGKVNQIGDALRKKSWQIVGQMQDEQAKLRDLYLSDNPERSALVAVYRRLFDLRLQQVEAMLVARTELEKVLTKEQRDALRHFGPGGTMGRVR